MYVHRNHFQREKYPDSVFQSFCMYLSDKVEIISARGRYLNIASVQVKDDNGKDTEKQKLQHNNCAECSERFEYCRHDHL